MSRSPSALLAMAALVAACSSPAVVEPSPAPSATEAYPGWPGGVVSTDAKLIPILLSSDLAVGQSRVAMTLVDDENRLVSAPDLDVMTAFYDLAADPARPTSTVRAEFIWAVEGERGLYASAVEFPRAGRWGVEVRARWPDGSSEKARVSFPVRLEGSTPAIGSPAPPSQTPTAESLEAVASISTDDDPDLDFYKMSIRRAIDLKRPFVVVFATPKFCTSRVCGPTLDKVKAIAGPYKSKVNFIHVEVFENLEQPDNLNTVPSMAEWGLPSEPWVFVVDGDGRVRAKFEGVVGDDELKGVLDTIVRRS